MGTIKNRTTLEGRILSLVANGAVGPLTTKENTLPFERRSVEADRAR